MKRTITDLPEDVLLEVLSLVPRKDLILNCRLVCSRWRDLVDLPVLWRRKCQKMGFHPERSDGTIQDWRTFYFHHSKKNLVKNPCGEEGLDFWEFSNACWYITEELVPSDHVLFYDICPALPRPPQEVQKSFILTRLADNSVQHGIKRQLITLSEEGFSDQMMDETRPNIPVKDWHYLSRRSHCDLHVKLLSACFEVLQECYLTSKFDDSWNEVSHTFDNYPPGVRHIELEHKVLTWSYVKITGCNVTIDREDQGQTDLPGTGAPREPLWPRSGFFRSLRRFFGERFSST